MLYNHVSANLSLRDKNISTDSVMPKGKTNKDLQMDRRVGTYLGVSIDLQALLRHILIFQEIQRHPYQMASDLIQFGSDFWRRDVFIVDVTLFDVFSRSKVIVLFEGFNCIAEWIWLE